MSDGELFRFEHVAVEEAGVLRLRDADGVVPDGTLTAIVGPSGSGKSTLLRCCNRLVAPTSGRLFFRGADVASIDTRTLRRRVGMVFQRPTPFAGTGLDNLLVADPSLDDEGAAELLARVQLDASILGRSATELSGGEAQRLCLARSLAARPEVLLMDEATSSLDPDARAALERLASTCVGTGVPVVWVTHDFAQARRLAAHVLVIIEGVVAHAGPIATVRRDACPEVQSFLRTGEGGHDAE